MNNSKEYQATLVNAANTLSELFPKIEKEPVYSIGFQRWQKLSKAKSRALMIKNGFDYDKCIEELNISKS